MFVIASRFELQPLNWPSAFLDLLSTNTIAVAWILLVATGYLKLAITQAGARWLVSSLIILIASAVVAVAKAGGGQNSYIPAYLIITVATIVCWKDWLAMPLTARHRGLSLLLVALVSADAFSIGGAPVWYKPGPNNGSVLYEKIIAAARSLEGTVLSPDDPTIAFRAKGTFCRNVVCELDAEGQNHLVPSRLLQEWATADYIIRVEGMWTSQVPQTILTGLGFRRIEHPPFDGRAYSLWKKDKKKKRKHD